MSAAAAASSSPAAAAAGGGAAAAAAHGRIRNTTWPDAMIHPGEEHFFSIVCGNTHYHWALHDGYREEFYPLLFWRTTTLEEDEWKKKEEADACLTLDRYLPDQAQEFIYGKEDYTSTAGASAASASASAGTAAETNNGDGAGGAGGKKKNKRLQLIKHNKTTAAMNAALRRVPAVTVYLVTTGADASESGLEYLFRDVPCNMHRFRASDFFSEDRGAYPGMGIDRLAALKAAVGFYGSPALVIDGGTCWTYTAADCQGNVAGGSGITNGLSSKFGALAYDTGTLPTLTPDEVLQRVRKAADKQEPIPFDARDTKDCMISGVLRESALHITDVVKRWYRQSKPAVDDHNKAVQEKKKKQQQQQQQQGKGKAKKKDGEAAAAAATAADDNDNDDVSGIVEDDDDDDDGDNAVVVNSKMRICITGGDSEIIGLLLKDNHSHVVECGDDEGGFRAPDVEVKRHKHLIHHAVQILLSEKARSAANSSNAQQQQESDVEKHRKELLGQRVAKEFPDRPDERNKDPIYRGTLVTCDRGGDVDGADSVDDDLFRVQYDDGDGEDLNVNDVYEGLLLYHRTGEKHKESIPERREKQKTKVAEAKRAAEFLEVHSPKIKGMVDKEREKSSSHKRKKTAAAASATSPSAAPPAAKKARTAEPAAGAGSAGAGAGAATAKAPPPAGAPPPVSGEKALKRRVAKYFDDVVYFGAVAKFLAAKDNDDNTDYYHVVYDDGDEEDMEHAELLDSLALYEEKKEEDEQS